MLIDDLMKQYAVEIMLNEGNINSRQRIRKDVIAWFDQNGRSFPWRNTNDPFHILLAEIVLKLTGAWKAERVYDDIVGSWSTPALMANANQNELLSLFRPLGLYNRANNMIEISRQLIERFDSSVPRKYDDLISLRGVGEYTANAILCLAYGERVPMVDGSVSRLYKRCLGFETNKEAFADRRLWGLALDLLPKERYREYNLGILDIGSMVCSHHNPKCSECPLGRICIEKVNKMDQEVQVVE